MLASGVNSIGDNCYLMSNDMVGNRQSPALSDFETLDKDINPAEMRVHSINGC